MAAIVGNLTDENLNILIGHLKSNLQQQSVPVFIRKVDKIPKTANFKTRKVELVQEGFKCENVWLVTKVSLIAFILQSNVTRSGKVPSNLPNKWFEAVLLYDKSQF